MRYVMHVASRALPGRDEEYDTWYQDIHRVEMLELEGVNSCDRFREYDTEGQETGVFIAQYGVETDDPAALLQSIFAAAPNMRLTDAIDMESVRFAFLKPSAG